SPLIFLGRYSSRAFAAGRPRMEADFAGACGVTRAVLLVSFFFVITNSDVLLVKVICFFASPRSDAALSRAGESNKQSRIIHNNLQNVLRRFRVRGPIRSAFFRHNPPG